MPGEPGLANQLLASYRALPKKKSRALQCGAAPANRAGTHTVLGMPRLHALSSLLMGRHILRGNLLDRSVDIDPCEDRPFESHTDSFEGEVITRIPARFDPRLNLATCTNNQIDALCI